MPNAKRSCINNSVRGPPKGIICEVFINIVNNSLSDGPTTYYGTVLFGPWRTSSAYNFKVYRNIILYQAASRIFYMLQGTIPNGVLNDKQSP